VAQRGAARQKDFWAKRVAAWKAVAKGRVKLSSKRDVIASKKFTLRRGDFPLKGMPRRKMPIKQITVELWSDFPSPGGWSDRNNILVLRAPFWSDPAKLATFDSDVIGETLRHELIHVVQTTMSGIVGGKKDPRDKQGKRIGSVARPGMPSKRIMTPRIAQFSGGDSKEFSATRDALKGMQFDPEHVSHGLDDIEFYTALSDSISRLKPHLAGLNSKEKRKVIGLYTGAIKSPRIRPFDRKAWEKFDPRKKIYTLMYPGASRRKPFKVPNPYFMVWKRHAKGKWRKAVKELAKAL
jgi:hypothetical protein